MRLRATPDALYLYGWHPSAFGYEIFKSTYSYAEVFPRGHWHVTGAGCPKDKEEGSKHRHASEKMLVQIRYCKKKVIFAAWGLFPLGAELESEPAYSGVPPASAASPLFNVGPASKVWST
jgi:hypothetical protein